MPDKTSKQMLLELAYDGDLAADVGAMLATGQSWREIAARVGARTGHPVSHESMRRWYGGRVESAA